MWATRFRAEGFVPATPDETFAGWTALQEEDAGRVMPPLRTRDAPAEPPDSWEVLLELSGWTSRDDVRLTTASGGTRVTMDLEMDLSSLFQSDVDAVNRKLQ